MVLEEVPALCIFCDVGVDQLGFGEAEAIERGGVCYDAHFRRVEDKGKVPVPPAPRIGVEVGGVRRELFDELSDGREGGLPNYCVERHGRHASADHFGDGRHRGGDGGHVVRGGRVFF